jgi:hypothetical protein
MSASPFPPRTGEGETADEALDAKVREAVEYVRSLPPVDRALLLADQRRSFARSMYEGAQERLKDDPLYVLSTEVRRLREMIRDLEAAIVGY